MRLNKRAFVAYLDNKKSFVNVYFVGSVGVMAIMTNLDKFPFWNNYYLKRNLNGLRTPNYGNIQLLNINRILRDSCKM